MCSMPKWAPSASPLSMVEYVLGNGGSCVFWDTSSGVWTTFCRDRGAWILFWRDCEAVHAAWTPSWTHTPAVEINRIGVAICRDVDGAWHVLCVTYDCRNVAFAVSAKLHVAADTLPQLQHGADSKAVSDAVSKWWWFNSHAIQVTVVFSEGADCCSPVYVHGRQQRWTACRQAWIAAMVRGQMRLR